MKILLGIPELPPHHIGGGGIVYENLIKEYSKRGHDVIVLYGYYPTKSLSEKIIKSQKGRVVYYQIPEIPYPKNMPFLQTVMPPIPKAWSKLKSIIQTEKPDIAHLHGYGWPYTNILAGITHRLKIPYILTIHGYPETQRKFNAIVKLAWDIYIKTIQKKTLKNAHTITAISDYVRKDKRNIYPDKSVTVYNGVNLEDFQNLKKDLYVRKKHNIPHDTLVIYSVGRLAEMKGFQLVIELLPKFIEKDINVRFIITGDDYGYKPELEKMIHKYKLEKHVDFISTYDKSVVYQYIKQCDLYAVPSLWEPFGLTVLEGIAFNKTILTTEAGGIKEILKDYKNKINLYDQDLIRNIINFKEHPPHFDFTKFSWKNTSEKYLELLNKMYLMK